MVKERKGKVLRCEQVLGGHGPVQRMAYDLACRGVKEHCIAKAHSTHVTCKQSIVSLFIFKHYTFPNAIAMLQCSPHPSNAKIIVKANIGSEHPIMHDRS